MTCPYCETRPLAPYRGAGPRPVHCGDAACRLLRRRETNRPGWDRLARSRKDERDGGLRCRYCATSLVYAGSGIRPTCCWSPECRLRYGNERARAYAERKRASVSPRHADVPAVGEAAEHVDRLLAAAERRRKRHERLHGRRYTVDPWSQRPGRSTLDGAMRASEVAE